MKNLNSFLLLVLVLISFYSCKQDKKDTSSTDDQTHNQSNTIVAEMNPKSGSKVSGTVTFKELDNGDIMYNVSLTGLEPKSKHAIHIHEIGDCNSEDGKSAGGHWNPNNQDHGHLGHTDEYHLGDIGNLKTNAKGSASLSGTTDKWSLQSGESNNILGKAIIVHAKADDFKTQPTGAAGTRIACGVIK